MYSRRYFSLYPQNHNIYIIIKNNCFERNGQRVEDDVSYVTYRNMNKEVADFETVKKDNYREIYDIIKCESDGTNNN